MAAVAGLDPTERAPHPSASGPPRRGRPRGSRTTCGTQVGRGFRGTAAQSARAREQSRPRWHDRLPLHHRLSYTTASGITVVGWRRQQLGPRRQQRQRLGRKIHQPASHRSTSERPGEWFPKILLKSEAASYTTTRERGKKRNRRDKSYISLVSRRSRRVICYRREWVLIRSAERR